MRSIFGPLIFGNSHVPYWGESRINDMEDGLSLTAKLVLSHLATTPVHPVRRPIYYAIETIRSFIRAHWGVLVQAGSLAVGSLHTPPAKLPYALCSSGERNGSSTFKGYMVDIPTWVIVRQVDGPHFMVYAVLNDGGCQYDSKAGVPEQVTLLQEGRVVGPPAL